MPMTMTDSQLLEQLSRKLKAKSQPAVKHIGSIVGYSEQRSILAVKDILGGVVELVPLDDSICSLQLCLEHPTSGETMEFSVKIPEAVAEFYTSTRVKVARSVEHLSHELSNSLNGVKDYHDNVVDAAEAEDAAKPQRRQRKPKPRKTSPKKK